MNEFEDIVSNLDSDEIDLISVIDIGDKIEPNTTYQIVKDPEIRLIPTTIPPNNSVGLGYDIPEFGLFIGDWLENGTLEINKDIVQIPPILATKRNITFYGCRLLDVGESLEFVYIDRDLDKDLSEDSDKDSDENADENADENSDENSDLSARIIEIGKGYLEEIVRSESGEYLEYKENPHLYVPYNSQSSGHIIVAKVIDDRYFFLTAFMIPYGSALYIPPRIVHTDSHLLGQYLMVHSAKPDNTTAYIRNIEGKKQCTLDINDYLVE